MLRSFRKTETEKITQNGILGLEIRTRKAPRENARYSYFKRKMIWLGLGIQCELTRKHPQVAKLFLNQTVYFRRMKSSCAWNVFVHWVGILIWVKWSPHCSRFITISERYCQSERESFWNSHKKLKIHYWWETGTWNLELYRRENSYLPSTTTKLTYTKFVHSAICYTWDPMKHTPSKSVVIRTVRPNPMCDGNELPI